METANLLGAKSGREVKMGNGSLELLILETSAVRVFSESAGLVFAVEIRLFIFFKLAVEKYT